MLSSKHRIVASTVLAAVALLGVRTAQAATGDVLIGDGSTSACSSSQVRVDYAVAYSPAAVGYAVTTATVTGLDPGCAGSQLTVTVADAAGAPLTEVTATVDGTALVIPVVDVVPAEDVVGVSVVVAG